jgi:hypothetical protein
LGFKNSSSVSTWRLLGYSELVSGNIRIVISKYASKGVFSYFNKELPVGFLSPRRRSSILFGKNPGTALTSREPRAAPYCVTIVVSKK